MAPWALPANAHRRPWKRLDSTSSGIRYPLAASGYRTLSEDIGYPLSDIRGYRIPGDTRIPGIPGYRTWAMSLCDYVTMTLCDYATMSQCHYDSDPHSCECSDPKSHGRNCPVTAPSGGGAALRMGLSARRSPLVAWSSPLSHLEPTERGQPRALPLRAFAHSLRLGR